MIFACDECNGSGFPSFEHGIKEPNRARVASFRRKHVAEEIVCSGSCRSRVGDGELLLGENFGLDHAQQFGGGETGIEFIVIELARQLAAATTE
jgi:hypothetical protein